MLKKIIIGLCLFFSQLAFSDPRIYKLDLSYEKIYDNQDPMIDVPVKQWTDAVSFEAGIEWNRFYLNPMFHFESAYQKVTTVGLQFHTGFKITDWLDLDYMHHSRHTADQTNTYAPDQTVSKKYALFDSYGVVIHFVPNARK